MHRPSSAIVISLTALFFAMSGTAVAATGGGFVLGKSNTATAVTSLSNTKGTALSLSSTSTTPPLKVSNSVQVPKLNTSELGGQPASAFLRVNGTAVNSSELGQIPASGFIQGGGTISDGRLTLTQGAGTVLVSTPDISSYIMVYCNPGPADVVDLQSQSTNNVTATWWNSDGGVGQGTVNDTNHISLDGSSGTAVIVVQVDTGSSISTYTVTESTISSECYFTGQVVKSNA